MSLRRCISFAVVAVVAVGLTGCKQEGDQPVYGYQNDQPMMGNSAGMAFPTGDKSTSVIWLEKSGPEQVVVGQEFDYRVRVKNLTDMGLNEVRVVETLPAGFNMTGSSPQMSLSGRQATWNVGDLAAGATKEVLIRGTAQSDDVLIECSDVSYKLPPVCISIKTIRPALALSLSAPDMVILCDPIVSTLTVRNTGSGAADNVQVRLPLPQGLETLDGKTEATFDAGTLAAGQSREFTVRARAQNTGNYTMQGSASASPNLTASSDSTTTSVRNPVLAISKSGADTRYVGRPVTYTINVANQGDAPATDTVLTDEIPAGANFVSATEGGKAQGGKISWNLGTIQPGDSRQVSVTLNPTRKGQITSTATATAYCTRDQAGVSTTVKGIPAILLECVDLSDPVEVGSNTTYEITVTNQGSADDTNIRIECELPQQLKFVSASGPTKETVQGQKVTFAPLADLAPGEKAVWKLQVQATGTGDVRFGVKMSSGQIPKPVQETESTNLYE